MTREMNIILNFLDAILTEGQRATMVKIIKLTQAESASSKAGADDLRQTLDCFQGTLSIRKAPNDPSPIEPEVLADQRAIWLALFQRVEAGDDRPVRNRLVRVLEED